MTAFPDHAATDYDTRVPRLVPGYDLAQHLAASLAATLIAADSTILVAGCGTGNELMLLSQTCPCWNFVAIDPSAGMLAKARAKAEEAGIANRVTFQCATLETAPVDHFGGAVSFLVTHFLADDGAKLRHLRALAARLDPNAPAFFFDFGATALPQDAYAHWMRSGGANEEAVEAVRARIENDWHPVSGQRFETLLEQAGFQRIGCFFSALGYRAVLAFKASSDRHDRTGRDL